MSRRTGRAPRAGAIVLAWIFSIQAHSCVAPRRPNDECLFNSDCPSPLVCAGQRCRTPCRTDRDCVDPERCRPSGQPNVRVCLPPGSFGYCNYTDECDLPLVCLMESRTCGEGCASDDECARARGPGFRCGTTRRQCESTTADGGLDSGQRDVTSPADASSDGTLADVATDTSSIDAIDDVATDDAPLDVVDDAPDDVADSRVVEPRGCTTPVTHRFVRACASQHLTCAISIEREVYCWGSNATGQIARPTSTMIFDRPQRIEGVSDAIDIGCAQHEAQSTGGSNNAPAAHVCAQRSDGSILCWGDNRRGQLGTPTPTIVTTPTAFTVTDGGRTITSFARMRVGAMGVHVIAPDGTLYFAGRGTFNGAGTGSPGEVFTLSSPAERVETRTPVDNVFSNTGETIATFAGATRAVQFGDIQEFVSFGAGLYNTRLAVATELPLASIGVAVSASAPVVQLSLASSFRIALLADGRAFGWGSNDCAQVGSFSATVTNRGDRVWPVESALGVAFTSLARVATAQLRSIAVDRAGNAYLWGAAGMGTSCVAPQGPTIVPAISQAMDAVIANSHQCVLRRDGRLLCWGCNDFGALGRGAPATGATRATTCTVRTSAGENQPGFVCF
ncbi:MAG: hypothetical protein JNK05_31970 [Myxococcales bacterium]|nr:hypothetical protein [Myxococcales bacterium]